jgi:NAD(P)-dependent dehydrogenase (short-subunit alcohol dehydrogenase family)
VQGRLKGKVAIVTGAASGQGAEVARLFAKHGAKVAAFDINTEGLTALTADTGTDVLAVHCDVASSESVQAGIAKTVEAFGPVTVLYNNAAITLGATGEWHEGNDGPLADVTEDVFDRIIAVNLKSMFLTCKYTIPHMLAAGGGSIVNVASVGGVFVGTGVNAYCVSKGGVLGMSRALAHSYGPKGIRTNLLAPGYIETPMIDRYLEQPEFVASLTQANPLGRVGQSSEIAQAGLFLASDDSSYVNGAVLPVDGGAVARSL